MTQDHPKCNRRGAETQEVGREDERQFIAFSASVSAPRRPLRLHFLRHACIGMMQLQSARKPMDTTARPKDAPFCSN